MKRFFGLFIIFCLALNPCASAVSNPISIPNTHGFKATDMKNNYVEDSHNVTTFSDSDILNYTELLHFLERGKNLPEYILMDGTGSDLSKYTFKIANKVPDDYRSLEDVYNGPDFNDECWKNTIFYLPTVNLGVKFCIHNTDSTSSINMTDYWSFKFDICNTQYYIDSPIDVEFPICPFETQDDIVSAVQFDPLGAVDIIGDWCDDVSEEMNKGLDTLESNGALNHAQNLRIGLIRNDKTVDRYWSPDTYGGYYENVDDDGLEYINWFAQGIKVPLLTVRNELANTILSLEESIYGLELVKQTVPDDFGMSKPLEIDIGITKGYKLSLSQSKANMDTVYTQFDMDTSRISGEKSYRTLVRNGRVVPRDLTPGDIRDKNKDIDKQIKVLESNLKHQKDIINNDSFRDDMLKQYDELIDYYDTIINTYVTKNGPQNKIDMFNKKRDKAIKNQNSTKEQFKNMNLSKDVLPKYEDHTTTLIKILEGNKA